MRRRPRRRAPCASSRPAPAAPAAPTAWPSSSPRRRWAAATGSGGRPTAGASPSPRSTRPTSRSTGSSTRAATPSATARRRTTATRSPAPPTRRCGSASSASTAATPTWADLGEDWEYLARVDWLDADAPGRPARGPRPAAPRRSRARRRDRRVRRRCSPRRATSGSTSTTCSARWRRRPVPVGVRSAPASGTSRSVERRRALDRRRSPTATWLVDSVARRRCDGTRLVHRHRGTATSSATSTRCRSRTGGDGGQIGRLTDDARHPRGGRPPGDAAASSTPTRRSTLAAGRASVRWLDDGAGSARCSTAVEAADPRPPSCRCRRPSSRTVDHRDGATLDVLVYRPAGRAGPFPTIVSGLRRAPRAAGRRRVGRDRADAPAVAAVARATSSSSPTTAAPPGAAWPSRARIRWDLGEVEVARPGRRRRAGSSARGWSTRRGSASTAGATAAT